MERLADVGPGQVRVLWTDAHIDPVPWLQFKSRCEGLSVVAVQPDATVNHIRGSITAALAEHALRVWPRWNGLPRAAVGSVFPTKARAEVARAISSSTPGVTRSWLDAALWKVSRTRAPRVTRLPLEVEADHLLRILGGTNHTMAFWQPSSSAMPEMIGGALSQLDGFLQASKTRLIVAIPEAFRAAPEIQRFAYRGIRCRLEAEVEEGKPHHFSPGEQLLFTLFRTDPELRGLFAFNRRVRTRAGAEPIVDAVWMAGKMALEVDGWQHLRQADYEADRRRDQQLMASGYIVLRVMHSRVMVEPRVVLEDIRQVVRARRAQGIGEG